MADLIILAILLAGPQHGYALKKRAGLVLNQPALHNNTIYPLLNRFIERGWVSRKETDGQRGQTRQVYSLTRAGRDELIERLSAFDDKQARSENEFHLRVSLFELLPSETRQSILAARTAVLDQRDDHLHRLQKSERLSGFNAEVVAYKRQQIESEIQWIRKLSRRRSRI